MGGAEVAAAVHRGTLRLQHLGAPVGAGLVRVPDVMPEAVAGIDAITMTGVGVMILTDMAVTGTVVAEDHEALISGLIVCFLRSIETALGPMCCFCPKRVESLVGNLGMHLVDSFVR